MIVIVGAGPAGLAAAEAASSNGQRVLLVDENHAPGGQIWRGGPPHWQDRRAHALWDALRLRSQVRVLHATRVLAPAGPGQLLIEGAAGSSLLAWERAIVCSGARELLLPFPGWTLPGVTGAGGLQALVKGGVPVEGKRVLVAGSGPLLLAAAAALQGHGARVVGIAEHRGTGALLRFGAALAQRHPGKLRQALGLALQLRGVPYLRGASVVEARGAQRLEQVVLDRATIDCDYLACGFGLVPALETAGLFGCASADGRVQVDQLQATSVPGVWAAGESTGIGGVDKALAQGRIAGLAASGQVPTAADLRARARAQDFADLLARSFAPTEGMRTMCRRDTIVCRCEDVREADLRPFNDWRSAKLQTRLGMGACQGRVCGSACALLYGWEAPGLRTPALPASARTLSRPGEPG